MENSHFIHRVHNAGNYVLDPEYSNEQGVVMTIKSLATGLTMKVYLDEPTHRVDLNGMNVTTYEGHFDEGEFTVTWPEGIEITGFPLVYPYWGGEIFDDTTTVIDTQNHSLILKIGSFTDQDNIASYTTSYYMIDFPYSESEPLPTSGNVVEYVFTRSVHDGPK